MFRVILTNGTIKELPGVTAACLGPDNVLICSDVKGVVVEQFEQSDAIAFGFNDAMVDLAKRMAA